MIIIDAGVEREATAEEEVYIKKMHFYDEMMEKKDGVKFIGKTTFRWRLQDHKIL